MKVYEKVAMSTEVGRSVCSCNNGTSCKAYLFICKELKKLYA